MWTKTTMAGRDGAEEPLSALEGNVLEMLPHRVVRMTREQLNDMRRDAVDARDYLRERIGRIDAGVEDEEYRSELAKREQMAEYVIRMIDAEQARRLRALN
jgi:hypothetical protein